MRMRLLADSLDEHPEHLALKFIGEWAALERRVHILESQMLDSHDEWEWLHSHLAGFLPGAYLDDNTEEDDDEGWD